MTEEPFFRPELIERAYRAGDRVSMMVPPNEGFWAYLWRRIRRAPPPPPVERTWVCIGAGWPGEVTDSAGTACDHPADLAVNGHCGVCFAPFWRLSD